MQFIKELMKAAWTISQINFCKFRKIQNTKQKSIYILIACAAAHTAEFDSLLIIFRSSKIIESVDLTAKHNAIRHTQWVPDNFFNSIILLPVSFYNSMKCNECIITQTQCWSRLRKWATSLFFRVWRILQYVSNSTKLLTMLTLIVLLNSVNSDCDNKHR